MLFDKSRSVFYYNGVTLMNQFLGVRMSYLLTLSLIFIGFHVSASETQISDWAKIREDRLSQIQRYVSKNSEGYSTFVNESIGQGPIPSLIFALLPELFPSIWGGPNESMKHVGLTRNKEFSNHQLPLGIGMESVSLEQIIGPIGKNRQLNMSGFNCAACHTGQVELSAGNFKNVLGAPNTRINNVLFMFARTVTHPDFKTEKIIDLLQSKPLGTLYGHSKEDQLLEAQDRQVFAEEKVAEALIQSMRKRGAELLGGFEKYVRPRTYNSPGQISPDPYALKRGSMDAFLPLHLSFVSAFISSPTILNLGLPKYTSETDIPSVWLQRNLGRVGHWDGNHLNPLYRNVGAAAAGLNNPVNIKNVKVITEFLQDFPPEPYPFDVNLTMAKRGQKLFQKNCTACHSEKNQVYSLSSVGTSENRLKSITLAGAIFLGKAHLSLCHDQSLCSKKGGDSFSFYEIARKSRGYVAGPLHGIWARAPYLHNGSVPTLHALLTGDRPKKFYRGNIKYDQRLVGFKWDQPSVDSVLYDTELSGNSNRGHEGERFLGFDPKREPNKVWDLIEYLKTL